MAPTNEITVTPKNSPYPIPGGTTNYTLVKIQGGWLQFLQQAVSTMDVLNITSSGATKRTSVLGLHKVS